MSPWPPDGVLALYAWGVLAVAVIIVAAQSMGPRGGGDV